MNISSILFKGTGFPFRLGEWVCCSVGDCIEDRITGLSQNLIEVRTYLYYFWKFPKSSRVSVFLRHNRGWESAEKCRICPSFGHFRLILCFLHREDAKYLYLQMGLQSFLEEQGARSPWQVQQLLSFTCKTTILKPLVENRINLQNEVFDYFIFFSQ